MICRTLILCILVGCSSESKQTERVQTEKGLIYYDEIVISQAIDTTERK